MGHSNSTIIFLIRFNYLESKILILIPPPHVLLYYLLPTTFYLSHLTSICSINMFATYDIQLVVVDNLLYPHGVVIIWIF